MSDHLVTTIENRRSGARLIRFAGVLDEHNRLGEIAESVGAGMALINLSGIERINSKGVRDWITWLTSLHAKGTRPVLIACSPAVVDQLNRIKNFAGNAVVKSFQLPYSCATCNVEKRQLVHVADMGEAPYEVQPYACDACGSDMTMEVDVATYFAFVGEQIARAKRLPPTESSPTLGTGSGTEAADASGLARGSRGRVTPDQISRISAPQIRSRQSQPSLSAFQMPDPARQSERDLNRPPTPPPDSRPYIVAILALMILAVAVLIFMFAV